MRCARLLLLLPLAVLASCTAFDSRWTATPEPTTLNPAVPLAGKWEGSWQSDSTAYIGNLKAIILPTQKVTAKDSVAMQEYRAEVKMTLYDLFSNEHKVILNAVPDKKDGRVRFEGKVDRGVSFGGIHRYDGYVEDDLFFCDYTSDRDCGTFKMRRLTLDTKPQ